MIRPGSIAEAWHVLQAIPEFDQRRSLAQLQERLPASALVLIAEADGQLRRLQAGICRRGWLLV